MGAGAGSYEPCDRAVIAVEISAAMIAQRNVPSAPVVQASALSLPFPDKSFDASMAILTIHHWPDQRRGLCEMLRVTRKQCVVLTFIPGRPFWLTRDYFPEILEYDREVFSLKPFEDVFPHIELQTVPIPHDCSDGFLCAHWRRPEAYLDSDVRAAISSFARLNDVEPRIEVLRRDLLDGTWTARNRHLLDRESCDLGYRLAVARFATPAGKKQ